MRRLRLLAVPASVAALLVLPGAGSADNPVLTGSVGLDGTSAIGLTDASGSPVTHLAAGTYTLVVHDGSDVHDFHLYGPGVDVATTVGGVGDSTFTITLTDGLYRFVCDAHFTFMKGSFTAGTATTPPPAPAPAPAATRLTARVGPGATIALRGPVAPGRAVITVRDASKTDNFHLVGPGVNRATGVAFRGTVRWTVTLRAGRYVYRSDRHPRLRGSFSLSGS